MHELSIAHAVVSAVVDALPPGQFRVREVHVRIGALSGVVPQALQFAYEVAALDTPVQDAVLLIEELPVVVHCPACDRDVTLASTTSFRCPDCGTPSGDVRQGKEMELARIVYDDGPDPVDDPERGVVHAGGAP
jgi:hydrogenase nickel incorporation protein HypA/HybF